MEDNIFAEVAREGETLDEILTPSVDKELEVEKPAESQTEKDIEKLDLPDESVLKKNSAWERMREEKEESDRKLQELESKLSALESKKEEKPIEQPEFLTDMVGKNEEIARKWQQERASIKEEAKQELVQAQIEAQKKEAETREYWNKWTQERFSEVEQEFKVDFKSNASLKNELAKIMNDYTPTDDKGNLDYRKGMKLLTDLKKAEAQQEDKKVQVKKNIADATVSKETSTKERKNFVTRNDLRGGWRKLVGTED